VRSKCSRSKYDESMARDRSEIEVQSKQVRREYDKGSKQGGSMSEAMNVKSGGENDESGENIESGEKRGKKRGPTRPKCHGMIGTMPAKSSKLNVQAATVHLECFLRALHSGNAQKTRKDTTLHAFFSKK
jgi:hypothetical protein